MHRGLRGAIDLAALLLVGREQQEDDRQPKGRPDEEQHGLALSIRSLAAFLPLFFPLLRAA
jgi:hypothetical protein